MQTQEPVTCESLKKQYQVLQDIAEEYKALLINEGYASEKIKELRTTFDTQTENLRNNIVIYKKEKQEGIFYLSAEYRSGEEYIKVLEEKGYKVNESTKNLLKQLTNIPKEQVRLKKVTLEDLGPSTGGTVKEILTAAKKHNLEPCPPWVGPQYCMECDGNEENTIIGMEPLTNSSVEYIGFDVFYYGNGDRWFVSLDNNDLGSLLEGKWIFASPK